MAKTGTNNGGNRKSAKDPKGTDPDGWATIDNRQKTPAKTTGRKTAESSSMQISTGVAGAMRTFDTPLLLAKASQKC